jgi:hypothetical protein
VKDRPRHVELHLRAREHLNFIPKPHKPFQWEGQMRPEDLEPRHRLLAGGCRRGGVEFTWNDPRESTLEAILSRGDRRLSHAVYRAWQLGAKFDAWGEHHRWSAWQQALDEFGLSAEFYAYGSGTSRRRCLEPHRRRRDGGLPAQVARTLNQIKTLDCHHGTATSAACKTWRRGVRAAGGRARPVQKTAWMNVIRWAIAVLVGAGARRCAISSTWATRLAPPCA